MWGDVSYRRILIASRRTSSSFLWLGYKEKTTSWLKGTILPNKGTDSDVIEDYLGSFRLLVFRDVVFITLRSCARFRRMRILWFLIFYFFISVPVGGVKA